MTAHRDTINRHNAEADARKTAYAAISIGRVSPDNELKLGLDESESNYSVEIGDTAQDYYAEYVVSISRHGEASFIVVYGTENSDAANVAINEALNAWSKGD